jgi:hypothetical protein
LLLLGLLSTLLLLLLLGLLRVLLLLRRTLVRLFAVRFATLSFVLRISRNDHSDKHKERGRPGHSHEFHRHWLLSWWYTRTLTAKAAFRTACRCETTFARVVIHVSQQGGVSTITLYLPANTALIVQFLPCTSGFFAPKPTRPPIPAEWAQQKKRLARLVH